MGYQWMPVVEPQGKTVELLLSSDQYEFVIVSTYMTLPDSSNGRDKVYLLFGKYKEIFADREILHETQFDQPFLSIDECQSYAEGFIESRGFEGGSGGDVLKFK